MQTLPLKRFTEEQVSVSTRSLVSYSPRTGPVVLVARHYCNFERQYTLQAVIQSSAADSLREAYMIQKEKETFFNLQG